MSSSKQERMLEIFFRCLRGENLSVKRLANEYEVTTKSITRTINDLKAFLADHRDFVGNTELIYSYQDKCYRLEMDEFLTNKELFAVVKVLIGTRAFSKIELLSIISKLKKFTTVNDRQKLEELIRKELFYYSEIKHDCDSVENSLWKLITCIDTKKEITIEYYRMDRNLVEYRLRPISLIFADYYFYLIAYKVEEEQDIPHYFRVDRIKYIKEHRVFFRLQDLPDFNEGKLRQRSLLMWPGKCRTIRFEFTGPSVQAVLDKLPTAKIIERKGKCYLIEAEVYGDGIKMWLLSQGSWVKVVSPEEFVEEIKNEVKVMFNRYR